LNEEQEEADPSNEDVIPLAPATVAHPPYPLFETPKIDLAGLKADAFHSLRRMEEVWGMRDGEAEDGYLRVLDTLRVTVNAVRAVRAWSLAVPASSLTHHQGSAGIGIGKKNATTISTPSRPAIVGRVVSSSSTTPWAGAEGERDPMVQLRRRALDVLVCSRGLEEKFRVEEQGDTLIEEETDEKQEVSDPEDVPTPERLTDPAVPAPESDTENLWLFSERFGDTFPDPTPSDKPTWYERLASGDAGFVYRDDVLPAEVDAEREVVGAYLQAVEGVLACEWRGRGEEDEGDVFGGKARAGDAVPRMEDGAGGRSLPDWAVAERWKDSDRECSPR
jgi:hypothetical protein